jgi:hypothetical protein
VSTSTVKKSIPAKTGHVRSNEVRPSRLLITFRCRSDAKAPQNVANRLIRNAMTEILQGSRDAVVSLAAILAGHPDDQFDHLARPTAGRPG